MKLEAMGRINCEIGSRELIGMRGVTEGVLGVSTLPLETKDSAGVPAKLGMADPEGSMIEVRTGASTSSLLTRISCDSDTITFEEEGRSSIDAGARLIDWIRGTGDEDCGESTFDVVGAGILKLVGRDFIV
jgi:hypothetical protein